VRLKIGHLAEGDAHLRVVEHCTVDGRRDNRRWKGGDRATSAQGPRQRGQDQENYPNRDGDQDVAGMKLHGLSIAPRAVPPHQH
jgi:hypothetical protein